MNDSIRFEKGARVYVKDVGFGSVVYTRFSPPDFSTIAAVSVFLDSERHRPSYVGSLFSPERLVAG